MIEDDDWKFDSCNGSNYFDDIDDILLFLMSNRSALSINIEQSDRKYLLCRSSLTLRRISLIFVNLAGLLDFGQPEHFYSSSRWVLFRGFVGQSEGRS